MGAKKYQLAKADQTNPGAGIRVKYCDTFFSKGLGAMFKKYLQPDEGLILVDSQESRMNAGIHMLFMNFDLAVLWLDQNWVVVDKVLARKWRPMYLPQAPAQYVAELHTDQFDNFQIGDQLALKKITE